MHPECENCGSDRLVNDLTTIHIGGMAHPLCLHCLNHLKDALVEKSAAADRWFKTGEQ